MPQVLTLNGGSSSIRFSVCDDQGRQSVSGKIERMGTPQASMTVQDLRHGAEQHSKMNVSSADHRSAGAYVLDWLASQSLLESLSAVGHRVVHGMQHSNPELITPKLVKELKTIRPYDPEHLPGEIELIELVAARLPQVPQVACFDTAFHRSMPRYASLLPIPRRFADKGVQRYGFHGLSYTYLMEELERIGDPAAKQGKVILAHLGNGASLAAVLDGKSVDTSMGFTPTAGVVMSTRTGDLDPGIVGFLAETESMDAARFERMVTHESGLLGISETSSDIRDLLEREAVDVRAAEAVAVFCYQVKKWIGAFAAALGGIDTLVFAGGIGENAAVIRERICAGLQFLGIELDATANAHNAVLISRSASGASVRVIRTDEEAVIAAATRRVLERSGNVRRDHD